MGTVETKVDANSEMSKRASIADGIEAKIQACRLELQRLHEEKLQHFIAGAGSGAQADYANVELISEEEKGRPGNPDSQAGSMPSISPGPVSDKPNGPGTGVIVGYNTTSLDQYRALNIPEILENIFQYLPLQDLLNCREIASSWRLTGTSVLKRSHQSQLRSQRLEGSGGVGLSVSSFCTALRNTEGLPFRKFKFDPATLTQGDLELFLSKFGPLADQLSFGPLEPDLLFYILTNAPNQLKVLKLQSIRNGSVVPWRSPFLSLRSLTVGTPATNMDFSTYLTFMENLLALTPGLRRFHLQLNPDQQPENPAEELKFVSLLGGLSLEELRLFAPLGWDILKNLRLSGLKSLQISSRLGTPAETSNLLIFLSLQIPTLESLQLAYLKVAVDGEDEEEDFPKFPRLKRLSIVSATVSAGPEGHLVGGEILFARIRSDSLPVLTKIELPIHNFCIHFRYFGEVLEGVTSYVVLDADDWYDPEGQEQELVAGYGYLRVCFPNLTKLTVQALLNVDELEAIFESLTGLEHLGFVYFGSRYFHTDPEEEDDEEEEGIELLLGGLPSNTPDWLLSNALLLRSEPEKFKWAFDFLSLDDTRASLMDMKCLKTLKITVKSEQGKYLTDFSVYYTFLRLATQLTSLHLIGAKLSHEGIVELKQYHDGVVVVE